MPQSRKRPMELVLHCAEVREPLARLTAEAGQGKGRRKSPPLPSIVNCLP